MRLWSLHPKYLDAKGLVALWREALLAKKVLQGKTRGYRHHPQLERFRRSPRPLGCLHCYLNGIYDEATRRGYRFDRSKFTRQRRMQRINVTRGQIRFEVTHLLAKVKKRDWNTYASLRMVRTIQAHPAFRIVSGPCEPWEKTGRR